ncbi:hypothetical protein [Stenotrophomonas sp. PS02300]|uniref:hypothetical protein n=1 Tax=Stenotrophomonas sp. PS02300 TaxID=2991426 RepID=UPI00249B91B6|nr:hypothetical protein [Stenotrophomonas sp. PS02300]
MIYFPPITETEFRATEGARIIEQFRNAQNTRPDDWALAEGLLQKNGAVGATYTRGDETVIYWVEPTATGWAAPTVY